MACRTTVLILLAVRNDSFNSDSGRRRGGLHSLPVQSRSLAWLACTSPGRGRAFKSCEPLHLQWRRKLLSRQAATSVESAVQAASGGLSAVASLLTDDDLTLVVGCPLWLLTSNHTLGVSSCAVHRSRALHRGLVKGSALGCVLLLLVVALGLCVCMPCKGVHFSLDMVLLLCALGALLCGFVSVAELPCGVYLLAAYRGEVVGFFDAELPCGAVLAAVLYAALVVMCLVSHLHVLDEWHSNGVMLMQGVGPLWTHGAKILRR